RALRLVGFPARRPCRARPAPVECPVDAAASGSTRTLTAAALQGVALLRARRARPVPAACRAQAPPGAPLRRRRLAPPRRICAPSRHGQLARLEAQRRRAALVDAQGVPADP